MLTTDQRAQIERRLLQEREEAMEALQDFERQSELSQEEATGELSSYRFHPADLGTESMEREKQFFFASKEGERLYRVDAALRRLYADPETFGTCARCGNSIEAERLMLVPEAETCATCARELEAAG